MNSALRELRRNAHFVLHKQGVFFKGIFSQGMLLVKGTVHCPAPFPTEYSKILGIKCSVRHWKQILNLFMTPVPSAVQYVQ
jgi:hypothetical protein